MKRKCMVHLLLMAMLCSGCDADVAETDTKTTEQTDAAVTEDSAPRDGLPAELDYDGADVKFHAGLWMHVTKDPLSAYYAEELTGDMLNDTVYSRNHTVEERLDVKLHIAWHETDWESRQEELNYYTSAIMAGDDAFDIVAYIAHLLPSICMEGGMYNLKEMEYLDLSQP